MRKLALARREEILEAAIELALKQGYKKIRRIDIAEQIGVTRSLINYYFPKLKELKKAVLISALANEIMPILAKAFEDQDSVIMNHSDKKLLRKIRKYTENIRQFTKTGLTKWNSCQKRLRRSGDTRSL